MMNQSRKKNRVHNRAITTSARAARASRRSSQHQCHGTDGNTLVINNTNNNAEEIRDDEENDLEHGEIGVKRTWNKKPRTFDWILTEPAPWGPLSTELLRGYHGHVACHIWEKKVSLIIDRVSTLLFPLTRDLVSVKTYSWASAALACLYRELGKASRAGCT
ncbi:Protein MAIN-LIKE 1 [Bienertia sinuspersici]